MTPARLVWPLVPAGRCRTLLAAAAVLSALAAVAALVPAFVIYIIAAVIFDRLDIGITVMQVVFAGIAAVITRLGLLLLARNTAGSATELLSASIRARAAVALGALPLGTVAEAAPGAFETVLLDDVETVGRYVSGALIDTLGAWAMLLAAAALLVARDWRVATIVVAVAAAVLLAGRAPRSDAERERRARERLTAAIFDTVRALPLALSLPVPADGAASIRALVAADRRSADARIAQSAARRAQRTTLAGSLAALIVIAGAWFERTDLAVLVLFAAFGVRITGALSCVLQGEAGAGTVRAAAARIRALLDAPAQAQGDAELPDNSTLRFSHVDFAYPDGHMRTVLRDIDFIAAAGRVTAIVGPSGSGKTTLTRLAARFWDADSGCVTLGGVDVRSVPVDALMRRIAYVHQDVALLDDTVAANLKLGRPDASDDAMMLAASAAGAHAFISALPDGYRTLVGERGLHLSRGERQRLQIARALLKNAPLVILDEPTSSMDPATELEIQAALAPLFIGKTVLVVAHRLATVAAAHRIIVLDDAGSIEAQGSHAELLGASRTYARLWSDYASATSWPVPQSVRP